MKNVVRGALILSLMVVMGQGCNPFKRAEERIAESIVERAIERQSNGEVDVDFGDGKVDFKTEEGSGQMRVGEGSKLADNFPSDVPRYPGANYVSSFVAAEGKTGIANFRTSDSPEDVQAWFKSELESDGFTLSGLFQMGGSIQLYEKGEVKITVQTQVDEQGGGAVVSLQRAESN